MNKLTEAGRRILTDLGEGRLMNGDEGSPMWWIEGGRGVHASTARALVRDRFVTLAAHFGGHPGVDAFETSEAGRRALEEPS